LKLCATGSGQILSLPELLLLLLLLSRGRWARVLCGMRLAASD
jgi:hypothetical protein